MITIYIMGESNYYIGNCRKMQEKAIKKEEVQIPENKQIKIVNSEITFVNVSTNEDFLI